MFFLDFFQVLYSLNNLKSYMNGFSSFHPFTVYIYHYSQLYLHRLNIMFMDWAVYSTPTPFRFPDCIPKHGCVSGVGLWKHDNKQFLNSSRVSDHSTQFWNYLPRKASDAQVKGSILVLQDCPPPLLQRLVRSPRHLSMLLIDRLQIGGSNNLPLRFDKFAGMSHRTQENT